MPQFTADTLTAPQPLTPDSIAAPADTVVAQDASWAPAPFGVSTEAMAPFSRRDKALYHTSAPGWLKGVDAPVRRENVADNPGVLSLLVGVFVLTGLSMGHIRRLFRALPQRLWSVRRRGNAFDDTTSNETRTLLLLLGMMCVAEGILLYKWLGESVTTGVFAAVGALTGLAAAFYLFQFFACAVVGYVFTDKAGSVSWLRGLNATAALSAVVLIFPAVVALFYPSLCGAMLIAAGVLYVAARMVFVIKGFRIFYNNFLSLLYFILYLCTLEIIPVIVLYVSATEICKTL